MLLFLTPERAAKIYDLACSVLAEKLFPIRKLAELVGAMDASFPAVEFGKRMGQLENLMPQKNQRSHLERKYP